MDDLILMLRGAMAAEGKVGLKMNVRRADQDRVLSVLREHPKTSLNSPTVSPLTDPDWVALETIIPEDIVRHIMPALYQAGARGIVEYPLNKIIE
jgi:ATP phosphoribosyltransferase